MRLLLRKLLFLSAKFLVLDKTGDVYIERDYAGAQHNKAKEDFRTPNALRTKVINSAERVECESPLSLCYKMSG